MQVQHAAGTVSVDGWVKFACQPRSAALLRLLREKFDNLLAQRLDGSPVTNRSKEARRVIKATVKLLENEKPAKP
eukprot:scaffold498109_cov29-Prasinocladus_malaysianus.AAC.1